jgi:hypothetical protein
MAEQEITARVAKMNLRNEWLLMREFRSRLRSGLLSSPDRFSDVPQEINQTTALIHYRTGCLGSPAEGWLGETGSNSPLIEVHRLHRICFLRDGQSPIALTVVAISLAHMA